MNILKLIFSLFICSVIVHFAFKVDNVIGVAVLIVGTLTVLG